MEGIISRFEHISEKIFDQLDNKTLANSMETDRSWYQFLHGRKLLQIRIILHEAKCGEFENLMLFLSPIKLKRFQKYLSLFIVFGLKGENIFN